MTTDLEKQFFDTFGIKPYIEIGMVDYPQITDRILLELICILASNPIRILFEAMFGGIKAVELLKNSILLTCIANKDTIKHQVQKLFKEG